MVQWCLTNHPNDYIPMQPTSTEFSPWYPHHLTVAQDPAQELAELATEPVPHEMCGVQVVIWMGFHGEFMGFTLW